MNTKAIVVYVDDTARCYEEFSWLYKTWMIWNLNLEYDLIVYHNPSIKDYIPKHENIVLKPMVPLNKSDIYWATYPFVNSFAMFNDDLEAKWITQRYSHIMKTDCDIFLTKHMRGQMPGRVMIGQGGYLLPNHSDEVLDNLTRIQKELKLNRSYMHNVGASIFGETKSVLFIVREHFKLTKYLLETEWKTTPGKWPGWNRGVASMYAIELVVNHMLTHQHVTLYSLDEVCWENTIINKNTIHIHAWHSEQYFSKHAWFKGKYEKLILDIVPDNAAKYCHWIVSNELETLMKVIENEKDK